MAKYLGFLIAGGMCSGFGSWMLIWSIMGAYKYPFSLRVFIIAIIFGAIILVHGVTFLSIGLYKRSHRYEYII